MAYAVKADLQKRMPDTTLVQLTDFDNAGSMNDARITEALDAASAMVDSYAGGRYTLPLTASKQVMDLTLAIAVYKLHTLRPPAPEQVRQDYDDAVRLLRDVAAGKATLDQPSLTQTSEMDVKTKDHATDPDVFDKDELDGY